MINIYDGNQNDSVLHIENGKLTDVNLTEMTSYDINITYIYIYIYIYTHTYITLSGFEWLWY